MVNVRFAGERVKNQASGIKIKKLPLLSGNGLVFTFSLLNLGS